MENTSSTHPFMCKRCGATFDYKVVLVRHLKKQKPCPTTVANVERDVLLTDLQGRVLNTKTWDCQYCNKQFNHRQGKCKHEVVCKKAPRDNTDNDNNDSHVTLTQFKMLQEQCEILRQQVEALQHSKYEQTLPANTTNITNNMTNNVVINVNIREFDNENMDAIPTDFIQSCFMNMDIVDLIENLHCDPDFPENHNFRLVSIKHQLVEYFKNNRWISTSVPNGLDLLIGQACRIFKRHHRKHRDSILEDVGGEEEEQKLLDKLETVERLVQKHVRPIRKELYAKIHQNKSVIAATQ